MMLVCPATTEAEVTRLHEAFAAVTGALIA